LCFQVGRRCIRPNPWVEFLANTKSEFERGSDLAVRSKLYTYRRDNEMALFQLGSKDVFYNDIPELCTSKMMRSKKLKPSPKFSPKQAVSTQLEPDNNNNVPGPSTLRTPPPPPTTTKTTNTTAKPNNNKRKLTPETDDDDDDDEIIIGEDRPEPAQNPKIKLSPLPNVPASQRILPVDPEKYPPPTKQTTPPFPSYLKFMRLIPPIWEKASLLVRDGVIGDGSEEAARKTIQYKIGQDGKLAGDIQLLKTLKTGMWISESVIAAFVEILQKNKKIAGNGKSSCVLVQFPWPTYNQMQRMPTDRHIFSAQFLKRLRDNWPTSKLKDNPRYILSFYNPGGHWVLLCFDRHTQTWVCYDSLASDWQSAARRAHAAMREYLPQYFYAPFTAEKKDTMPQRDGHNCGAHVCSYIWSFFTGCSLPFKPDHPETMRRMIAYSFFNPPAFGVHPMKHTR